jgi:hypothetical protein
VPLFLVLSSVFADQMESAAQAEEASLSLRAIDDMHLPEALAMTLGI